MAGAANPGRAPAAVVAAPAEAARECVAAVVAGAGLQCVGAVAAAPAGKVVVGAGILIATSKVVAAGQSSGGDTTAVFGTGLVDDASGAGTGIPMA